MKNEEFADLIFTTFIYMVAATILVVTIWREFI